jgi:hypothetical protein
MKKSTLMIALGAKPKGDEDYEDEISDEAPEEDTSDEEGTDEEEQDAFDTFTDPDEDPATRLEAFRRAVKLCKSGY